MPTQPGTRLAPYEVHSFTVVGAWVACVWSHPLLQWTEANLRA
jgi:hypothetical protein